MKRILFIGNSYTYYNEMPFEIFKKMAESVGLDIDVSAVTKGGESLVGHSTEGHETYDKINLLFENEKFDYVILQEQSDTPAVNREKYFTGLEHFVSVARRNGAEPIIYGTWPKKEGHPNLEKFGVDRKTMAKMLDEAFAAAGEKFGIQVSYTSPCFDAIEKSEELVDLYNADRSHPSYAGSFTAALCLLNTVLDVDPMSVKFGGNLTCKQADMIKTVVGECVKKADKC